MYYLLAPLFALAFTKRISYLSNALKDQNRDKIKFETLFLFLTIIISIGLVATIQSLKF